MCGVTGRTAGHPPYWLKLLDCTSNNLKFSKCFSRQVVCVQLNQQTGW
jgi:hypothetical protein